MSSLQKFHRRTQPFKVNTLHTGTVSISGTAAVGSVLTASNNIADADGLGTFSYQWKRSGSAISGAISSTYTLVSADNANTITVTITYTDGNGFIESETSAATAAVITPLTIGMGNDTTGYYMGVAGDGTSKLYVAPKSTETSKVWGINGTVSTTNLDGLVNSNTLYSLGTNYAAAYYCKTLTAGGYNTWYLPSRAEINTLYSSKSATPFATSNALLNAIYFSSNEANANYAVGFNPTTGAYGGYFKISPQYVRAARKQ